MLKFRKLKGNPVGALGQNDSIYYSVRGESLIGYIERAGGAAPADPINFIPIEGVFSLFSPEELREIADKMDLIEG